MKNNASQLTFYGYVDPVLGYWISLFLVDFFLCWIWIRSSSVFRNIFCSLFCLQDGLKERELCVFFRNNHFSTMFKVSYSLRCALLWLSLLCCSFLFQIRPVISSDPFKERLFRFLFFFSWMSMVYPLLFNLQYDGELYLLATDQGYINQPDLVWEKLNEVRLCAQISSLLRH